MHHCLVHIFTFLLYLQDPDALKKSQGVGPIRKVLLVKEDHEGLGISITVSTCVYFLSHRGSNLILYFCKMWFTEIIVKAHTKKLQSARAVVIELEDSINS